MTPIQLSQGVLLTKQAFDRQQQLVLHYWVKTPESIALIEVTDQKPLFFIEQQQVATSLRLLQDCAPIRYQHLPLTTFKQQAVAALYFANLADFYQAKAILVAQHIACYEADIRPEDRYLMERFITSELLFTGHKNDIAQGSDKVLRYALYQQAKVTAPKQLLMPKQQISLRCVSIDVECAISGELFSIAAYSEEQAVVFMIGDKQQWQTEHDESFTLLWVANEKQLLQQFIAWFVAFDADIVIGWNVVNFDFQLLQKRCDLYQMPLGIDRLGKAPRWHQSQQSEQRFMHIAGRVVVDGIDAVKSATHQFASYSLEHVAQQVLGKGKQTDDVTNRAQIIAQQFQQDKVALARYNLEDCRLVWEIFQQLKLLEFLHLRSQLTGLTLDKVGGSVAAFTHLYLPKLHRAGYIAPNLGDSDSTLIAPGGYVMDSLPGLYRHVLVLDFKSLYPSIIRTFCIDPMGLIEGLKQPDNAIPAFDGACFSRTQHFLPDIIADLWQARDQAKAKQNKPLSQAIKIIMNSFYGVLGSTGCRFFDPRLSGAITKRGHQILKQTVQWINQDYPQLTVIYGDTDSIFVHVGDHHSDASAQALGNTLAQFINEQWQRYLTEQYQLTSYLEIEFERHFSRFFMPTIRGLDVGTKKRYAGLIQQGEQTQLIFKGLENVRTDWTQLAKDFQYQLYLKIFTDQPVEAYIRQIVKDILAGLYDDKLVFQKRLRRKLSHYVKNIPPHVKAARLADQRNQQLGKPLQYQQRGIIRYVMTTQGPQEESMVSAPLDYSFYIERQIAAIADAILPFVGLSFAEIVDDQLSLF
jgi:DNA polymerase-2